MAHKKVRGTKTLTFDTSLSIVAAESEDAKDATFSMVAYTGEPMSVGMWRHPVLIDINGLDVSNKSRPIFRDHSRERILGHTTMISKENGQVMAEGVLSGADDEVLPIVATSKRGFPWQASIGATAVDTVYVDEGSKVEANGKTFKGPLYLVRKSRLSEISIVALGADDNTSTTVAAKFEERDMAFEQWLEAKGLDAANMSPETEAALKAVYAKENTSEEGTQAIEAEQKTGDILAEAAEQARYVAALQRVCGGDAELLAEAIDKKWSVELAELKKENKELQAKRPQGGFAIHTRSSDNSDAVLEAAMCLSLGIPAEELTNPGRNVKDNRRGIVGDVRAMKPEVVEAADRQYSQLGFTDFAAIVASRDNILTSTYGQGREQLIRAAFTSISLPTVFQQALNRALLNEYQMAEFKWNRIATTESVPDFREITRFRVHGTGAWERLTPAGELASGQIEEGAKYTNKAKTIGQFIQLTREDFINDDLGALNRIARNMAFYGTLAPELEVFKAISDNSGSFFHADNDNLLSGGSSALSYSAMVTAFNKFINRRDPGVSKDVVKPLISVSPRILLVPSALYVLAQQLAGPLAISAFPTSGERLTGTSNMFAGMFDIVYSPYLADAAVSATASSTAWYLMADPRVMPMIEVVFLNGRQRPTIESVEPRPEVLGMGFRGYLDFGVKLQDPRAAVKCAGA